VSERVRLASLPPSMAERAVRARTLANEDHRRIHIDDEMLPWVFCEESDLWLSFDGNYSTKSPEEKRTQAAAYKARLAEVDLSAVKRFELQKAWSLIRAQVLERDKCRCQLCGGLGWSKLHAHHICKRKHGGTDHMDNLITVCNKCHRKADTELYDPDWEALP